MKISPLFKSATLSTMKSQIVVSRKLSG